MDIAMEIQFDEIVGVLPGSLDTLNEQIGLL